MKTDISEKKPAGADFSAKDSAKKPAGKPAKTAEKSAKTPMGKPVRKKPAANTAAKKPASRLKSDEATATAGKPAGKSAWKLAEGKTHASKPTAANSAAKKPTASRSGSPAKTREYPAKTKEFRTTGADGTAKSTPTAKKPKANPAEQKPIATTGRTVPADETAFLRTLGLAARARQTVMGTDMVCDALAEHRVRLVVEAGDTSENTHKRLTDKCITYRTPHVRLLSDGGTLGAALGKSGALAVCGVTGEIAKSLFAAWERLTASAPAVPEKVAKAKK